jgi:hypothetical protein
MMGAGVHTRVAHSVAGAEACGRGRSPETCAGSDRPRSLGFVELAKVQKSRHRLGGRCGSAAIHRNMSVWAEVWRTSRGGWRVRVESAEGLGRPSLLNQCSTAKVRRED